MRYIIALLVISILSIPTLSAAGTEVAEGRYTYILPKDMPEKSGRAYALEQARANAIAEQFGTFVSSTSSYTAGVDDKGQRETFNLFSTADVCGVWVKTIDEKVNVSVDGDDIIINAYVKGEVKERQIPTVDFEAQIGIPRHDGTLHPTTAFYEGDRFDISFIAPEAGYVAIYANDGVNNACRLLPPAHATLAEPVAVEGRVEYRFFSDSNPVLTLEPDEDTGLLRFTLLFVPGTGKAFALPLDSSRISEQGDVLGWDVRNADYNKWLTRLMNNPRLQRRDIMVKITRR